MDTFQWSKELTERLISLYQAREFLYNRGLPDYGYRKKRDAARTEIFNELKKVDPSISMDDVYLKCKSLRENYVRERKRFLNFKRCEQARDEDYVPLLWYYHKLHFFEPYLQTELRSVNDGSTQKDSSLTKKPNTQESGDNLQEAPRGKLHHMVVEANNCEDRLQEQHMKFANPKQILQKNISGISNILAKRSGKKYSWLGKEVVFEINKITSETLQEDAAWAIQSVLRSALHKDRLQQQKRSHTQPRVTSSTPKAARLSLQAELPVTYGTIDLLSESDLDSCDEEDC